MFSKYILVASSVFASLTAAASTVDLDALLLLRGVESHDGVNTVFSSGDFYQVNFIESIAPAIVNSSVIFHDVSHGVAIGNVKSRVDASKPEEVYYDWEQYQVVNSGDWRTEYAPASECMWRDEKHKGDDTPDRFPISVPFNWSSEYSIVDYDKDANEDSLDFKLIKSLLNKKKRNESIFVRNVNETVSQSSIMVAPMIKPYDVVQLWYSKFMIWANVQRQYCSGVYSAGTECGAWSRYYHVDAPTYTEPIVSYMTKMLEDEVQCPNKRNSTVAVPLHLDGEKPSIFWASEDEEEPNSKSLWSSLRDMFFKRS
ncbi:uncharacterized protein SKDI_03G0230 [Saccharomyces kudriavzevii IFO 1802]|uniref:YCL049C-like protein n=2 Tax=Saccharomyces kudriavzevii (strain ATCC MYA-4449 / AS 2.2408 / CBS 8840 / NBRC 1802 / NCYC 2889) TaxID=226230 RepID=J5RWN5_SACK1|nr:uncharacterized protein SKDI_03G0230 [Saccharomyces kudriavzevii IFO 1802]EJT42991.1 YCL049C-like protein [Saccharomyces kudriavzevii IFO 1802]CAI4056397.1 hypothetical protein SKDI_03G0230 [Saccharomyces kudriavzevii IFO 1802]